MPRIQSIRTRRGLAADWTAINPVLDLGEPGLETDTRAVKYGDGTTSWVSLPYAARPVLPGPFTPPPGAWQHPSHFLSSIGNGMVSGAAYFTPLDIGPNPKTFDRLGVNVTTAQVGGSTTFTLGLYPDDGTGGAPNTANGPLVSGAVALTTAGQATLTIVGVRAPGRYWMASFYNSVTAPTTAAQVSCIANASPGLWIPSTLAIGGISRALVLTGQSALPAVATSPVGTGSGTIPVIAARAA